MLTGFFARGQQEIRAWRGIPKDGTYISFRGDPMAKAMTKSKIADHLASKLDVSKKQANLFLDELAALAYKEARNSFTVPGLGKLVLVNRKARMGRNPQTGQPIRIPAKRVVRFRVSKAAKDAILGGR